MDFFTVLLLALTISIVSYESYLVSQLGGTTSTPRPGNRIAGSFETKDVPSDVATVTCSICLTVDPNE